MVVWWAKNKVRKMYGIAGYYSFNEEIIRENFEKMVNIIEYRGPDSRGTFLRIGWH